MKRASQKRSLEQLRSETWPDKASALKELKRSGFPERGEDYALGEFKPGSWMIIALDAEPVHESSVAEPEPEAPPAPTPETPETPAAPAIADHSPLPASDGPYDLCIREGETEMCPAHAANVWALTMARWAKGPVYIRNAKGKIVRTVAYEPAQRPQRSPRPSDEVGRRGSKHGSQPTSKAGRVVQMLLRPEGATFAELRAITEWSFGEDYIDRLARRNNAEWERVGERHWRLIKS